MIVALRDSCVVNGLPTAYRSPGETADEDYYYRNNGEDAHDDEEGGHNHLQK